MIRRKAFTLIELIIVIFIVAILGSLIYVALLNIGLVGTPQEIELTVIDKSSPIDGDGYRQYFVNTQLPDGTKMDYLARQPVFMTLRVGQKYTVTIVGNCITGTKH